MKAQVGAFNQEKALVGAFSVITNLRMELFGALICTGANIFATFPSSQLLVYDSADWSGGKGDLAAYHVPADTDTAEARVALMEKTVEVSRYFLEI